MWGYTCTSRRARFVPVIFPLPMQPVRISNNTEPNARFRPGYLSKLVCVAESVYLVSVQLSGQMRRIYIKSIFSTRPIKTE